MTVTVTAVLIGMHRAFLPPGAGPDGRVSLQYDQETVTLEDVMRDLAMPQDTGCESSSSGGCPSLPTGRSMTVTR